MALTSIRLRYYTDDEIRALAVVKVLNSSTYDRGVPKENGVNDPRMGVVDHTVRCPTCFKSNCDQHFGYIDLIRTVYRLGSITTVLMILRSVCRECSKPKFQFESSGINSERPLTLVQIPNIVASFTNLKERLKFISEATRNKMICHWCGAPQPNYTKRERTFVDATYRPRDFLSPFVTERGPEYLAFLKTRFMPDDAASILFSISKETAEMLGVDRMNSLMCSLQIVPPPIIRPSNFVGETKIRSENDLTCALQDVVRTNNEMSLYITEKKSSGPDYEQLYDKLQVMVSGIVNHAIKKSASQSGILPLVAAISKRKIVDLRGRLNGKKARVRGNLNGKRVDQSGRTVISGDASHDIDQLGVPTTMMNKLTFPEPVTSINLSYLKKCVALGSYVNGGAMSARPPTYSADHVIWIPMLDREARIELASQLRPGWIVDRHLVDGDIVLFNRQPSLWKASMMSFRIYRVQGLTCRLPLPVTRAFNADFDGDEMNIHALQGYEAIAEAQELMRVDKQIITPQSGTVIIGLVQDSLVGAWRLSSQDCLLTKAQACQMMMCIHYYYDTFYADTNYSSQKTGHSSVNLPEPAIFSKQGPLWTGKQIISLLIPPTISISKHSKDLKDFTGPDGLCIRSGIFLAGRLNKSHLGAGNTGLIQNIWRLYGPGGAHKFISDAQRLFVSHLDHDGPSQSVVDCIVDDKEVINILSQNLGRSDNVLGLDLYEGVKEAKSNLILQETLRSVGSHVLSQIRPNSALANCVQSGSKGNVMNIAQIGGCVGQQNIYGKRVQLRQTRLGPRTLFYYAPGDLKAEARGFVANSYMSGLTPSEFFAHQMAGREGIVATAVNTSETGYNQRRMIKGQESQCIGYDGTVRVSSNIIIQLYYGGDDLDGSRLERIHMSWIVEPKLSFNLLAKPCIQKALEFAKSYASWNANFYKDLSFSFPCAIAVKALLDSSKISNEKMTIETFTKRVTNIHSRHHSSENAVLNISMCCAILQFAAECGECSDRGEFLLDHYGKSLISAGEGVGALGASSIGEPSMQKTLNTFHYTGIADKNVTITGLPRFKQLINGVDTYETSNMSASLKSFERAQEAIQISIVCLRDILGPGRITIGKSIKSPLIFSKYENQRGHYYAKFGSNVGDECETFFIDLDWTLCVRKSITSQIVANALRDLFSFDAIVVQTPHWTNASGKGGPRLHVILAPWIRGDLAISESLMGNINIRGLDYLKNAIVFQEKQFDQNCIVRSAHIVETEGSNIIEFAKCASLIPETIRSTNVTEICAVLGISAGVATLQAELHKVLSFDGTYVDPRHSWLLADTMGRTGTLSAMNRHHMLDLGSSLLQEASFERSLEVFEDGAAFGRSDPLSGATERIIVGQPVSIGTGLVGIVSQDFSRGPEIIVAPLHRRQDDSNFDQANSHLHQTVETNPETNPQINPQTNNISQKLNQATNNQTNATIVRPLNYKSEKEFSVNVYAVRLIDENKFPASPFYENLSSSFRSISATFRIVPNMSIRCNITENSLKSIFTSCWAYKTWTNSKTTELFNEIHWDFPKTFKTKTDSRTETSFGITSSKISYMVDTLYEKSENKIDARIFSSKRLEPFEIPFGVESFKVIIRQQCAFQKGHFELIIGHEWSGLNNVEVEEKLLKCNGLPFMILNIVESEQILQNRSTDSQLANALENRMMRL
jgi:DNA-directed RNA polymerase II subunit RPB1